jgi:hypothetical protein
MALLDKKAQILPCSATQLHHFHDIGLRRMGHFRGVFQHDFFITLRSDFFSPWHHSLNITEARIPAQH